MNDQHPTISERTRDEEEAGFNDWMGRSETKLILSLLPTPQNETQRDCLNTLLRSAYHAGTATGSISVIKELVEHEQKNRARR